MSSFSNHTKRYLTTLCAALIFSIPLTQSAQAQGVATERELSAVTVIGTRSPLDPNLPASTFSTTRDALQSQSFLNTEDALNYAPNTTVRKRFIGDRNSNLGGRSFGTTQPARGLAYVDGYLISNFLGRFDAPRWSSVAPEEIARVDILYGPFSALYPGNSIGSTVAITTRIPKELEASASAQVYHQHFDDYGLSGSYNNNQQSAYLANRWNRLALAVSANRLAYSSQPLGYATATPAAGSVTGLTRVSGAVTDTDPSGARRVTVGAINFQHGEQEQAKLKAVYDLTSTLQADAFYSHWNNDARIYNQILLSDALSGNPIWKGVGATAVNIDGARYSLPTMAPQQVREEHQQLGARLRTRHQSGWNYSAQVSSYRILTNSTRTANVSDQLAGGAFSGNDTVGDGTGWNTLELQSTYTPLAGEHHTLTFGYHQNHYTLQNRVFNLANWNDSDSRSNEASNYFGKTEVQALYAQDAWRFLPDWTATLGWRIERFRAYDGAQFDATATAAPQLRYADRRQTGNNPKLSLAHVLNSAWLARASFGRGVRFPTVSELYQGAKLGTTLISNDPNLRPETSNAKELSLLREDGNSSVRISVFEDDIRNAIFQQQQIVGATTVTTVQNVGRVLSRGVEVALQANDLWFNGFDLQASVGLTNAKTIGNPALPTSEGKNWPRVPRTRAALLGSYRRGAWAGSLGIRHEGHQNNTLDNSDINTQTVGAVSSFTVADLKLNYSVARWGKLALGIDNLTDRRYYVGPHPYPGRTVYAEVKLNY